LIALAAVVLLGGTAHYFGLSGHVEFAFEVVAIFIASVLIPDEKTIGIGTISNRLMSLSLISGGVDMTSELYRF